MKYTKTIRASKSGKAASVKASAEMKTRRPVKAEEDIDEQIDLPDEDIDVDVDIDAPEADLAPEVTVEEEASTLLFEAEDVAELISEVTELPVDVTVDDEGEGSVTFAVGEDEYVITPEGDEEILEASKIQRSRRVSASAKRPARRPARRVSASRRAPARRVSASRRSSAAARRASK